MWFGLAISGLSILGAILNARKNIEGFYIWLVANTLWIVYDVLYGLYEQIPVWIVYNIICIYGIMQWKKIQKHEHR